jgi:hypothetical protein
MDCLLIVGVVDMVEAAVDLSFVTHAQISTPVRIPKYTKKDGVIT